MCMPPVANRNAQNNEQKENKNYFSIMPLHLIDEIFKLLDVKCMIRSRVWSSHFLRNTERYFLKNKIEIDHMSIVNNKLKVLYNNEQDFHGDEQLKWMQVKKLTLGNTNFHQNGFGGHGFLENMRTFVLLDNNVEEACYCVSKSKNLENLILLSNGWEEDDIIEILRLIRFDKQAQFQLVLDQQQKLTPRMVDIFLFITRKLYTRTITFTIDELWKSHNWDFYRDVTYFEGIIRFFETKKQSPKELETKSDCDIATTFIRFDYLDFDTALEIVERLHERNPRQTSHPDFFRQTFRVEKPNYGRRELSVKHFTDRRKNWDSFRMEENMDIDDGSREWYESNRITNYGFY